MAESRSCSDEHSRFCSPCDSAKRYDTLHCGDCGVSVAPRATADSAHPAVPNTPPTSAACEGWCEVAGSQTACELGAGHEYEHEATHEVEVFDAAGSGTLTNFLVWWGDDGHAFVGSKDAVNTGNIG